MIQTDDMQILKKIKTETNLKINKLTQDFSECAKLIEEIKISSNLEIPEQVNYLRKRLETASETDDTKKSSHRSRLDECISSKTISSSSAGSIKSSSKSPQTPQTPSMYRYYNPFSIQIKTNKELTRSLSPDDRIKMMKGKQDLSPRLVFIKNSMKEIGEKGM
jgi:hypothetical protein